MSEKCILIIGGLEAVFFGLQLLRIFPTATRLIHALVTHETAWPGRAVRDPDAKVAAVDQWLGKRDHLFPFFFKYAGGVLAAFLISAMTTLNVIFWWIVPQEGKEWLAFGIPLLLAAVAGAASLKRTVFAERLLKIEIFH